MDTDIDGFKKLEDKIGNLVKDFKKIKEENKKLSDENKELGRQVEAYKESATLQDRERTEIRKKIEALIGLIDSLD